VLREEGKKKHTLKKPIKQTKLLVPYWEAGEGERGGGGRRCQQMGGGGEICVSRRNGPVAVGERGAAGVALDGSAYTPHGPTRGHLGHPKARTDGRTNKGPCYLRRRNNERHA